MHVHVLAEIGCNWETIDDVETVNAVDMIYAAKEAGANSVKFQLFNKDNIKNSPAFDSLKDKILTEEEVKHLKEVADKNKIGFILTPMHLEAVDIAAKYCDEYIKIRFKDHENEELIDKALDTGKTLLISVPHLPVEAHKMFSPRMKFMYCLPKYPPEIEDFNLEFAAGCHGFSSHFPHTLCDLCYVLYTSYENSFVEKHVMLPNTKPLDEAVSITFSKLRRFTEELKMVERIRRIKL